MGVIRINKYIPNALTIMRLFLVPIFAGVYFSSSPNNHIYALIIFIIASLTDMLDGYIARKYNIVSIVGIVIDPLADKMLLITVLICIYITGGIQFELLIIMIIIETIMIIVGITTYFRKSLDVIPANKIGKTATVLFTAAVVFMILMPNNAVTWTTIIIAFIMKLISFTYYAIKFYKGLRGN